MPISMRPYTPGVSAPSTVAFAYGVAARAAPPKKAEKAHRFTASSDLRVVVFKVFSLSIK